MDCHQGRAARRIDRDGRPLESQREGHPTGNGIEGIAGDEVGLNLVERLGRQQMRVLVGTHPYEDAGLAAAQCGWRISSPFETLPCGFEHQTLLRLDPDSLTRGDAEEFRIESVDSVEESAEARVGLARGLWIRVVEL